MKKFKCSVAQEGFFAGPIYLIKEYHITKRAIDDSEGEIKKFRNASEDLRRRIKSSQASGENAEIAETVLSILSDDSFSSTTEKFIREQQLSASAAVLKVAGDLAEKMAKLDSEYIRSRSSDIIGIAKKLVSVMEGNDSGPEECSAICAGEISPAQLSSISKNFIGGIVTDKGSPNSHVSILAGSLAVPYLYGNGEAVEEIEKSEYVIIDSESRTIITNPDYDTRKAAEIRMSEYKKAAPPEKTGDEPSAFCLTGIYANIEGPQDIDALLESDADGVGLFRTEFMFLDRDTIPSEEEQYESYKAVLEAMGSKEVVIRTMDIGSDKKVPWLNIPDEPNPALGLRGVRVSLERKDLFRTQLRALLRAGTAGNLKIMFPMIASVWEVDEIIERVQEAADELDAEGVGYRIPELGIMIETPAAAMCAEEMAEKVSFFSIGTNDLTQYTLAIDREAVGLDRYLSARHEAVFRLIKLAIEGGHSHGAAIGVCGQLACDPQAIGRLIEDGIDELSVPVRKVRSVKKIAAEAERKLLRKNSEKIVAVADGEFVPMSEIPDLVFSSGSMGRCFGILPENGNVYSPVSGTITGIAESCHALTISADDGSSILVHVGIDTVTLGGRPFDLRINAGEHVDADQLLMVADIDAIKKARLSPMVIVVRLA